MHKIQQRHPPPAIKPAQGPPSPALSLFAGERGRVLTALISPMFIDDDEFGDFNFVASAAPDQQEDDEWGDFVATSLQSDQGFSLFVENSPDPIRPKGWEKPKGALPLSLFGDEETEEEPEPVLDGGSLFGSNGFRSSSKFEKDGAGLKDLIASLYVQEVKDPDLGGGEDEFDEGGWEFKEASSMGNGTQVNLAVVVVLSADLSFWMLLFRSFSVLCVDAGRRDSCRCE